MSRKIVEYSDTLIQLKQKIITLAGHMPKITFHGLVHTLGEKDPTSSNEKILLNQRIILILFTAILLSEKLGVPLKGNKVEIINELMGAGSKYSIPLLTLAANVLDEFPADYVSETFLQQFIPEFGELLHTPKIFAQDLLGKLYQDFNSRLLAKPLNMNFTRSESSVLLVGCALSLPNSTWGPLEEINKRGKDFTIIDPACGTGVLLLYSYYFFRKFCPSLETQANKDRYIGLDVVPLASTILSASWNLLVDLKDVSNGIFKLLSLGAGKLGSLDLLDSSSKVYDIPGLRQPVQLVLMNPPFSRSSGSNTAFGTLPAADQHSLGQHLKDLRKQLAYGNVGAAGQAADFMLLAHKLIEPGGRLAAVLPISCLFGAAWTPVRRLLTEQYHIEIIFTHPEAGQCNFSDKTHLSECMLIAKKLPRFQPDDPTTLVVQIRHLAGGEPPQAEVISHIVNAYRQQDPSIGLEQGNFTISAADPAILNRFSWSWGPIFRFVNSKLNTFILQTFEWQTLFFASIESCALKLRQLETLGAITHDRAAYRAIIPTSKSKIEGNYDLHPFPEDNNIMIPESLPAFWGRQNVSLKKWIVHANALLVKRPNLSPDQFKRHTTSKAECLLPETLRFNTSSLFALYCPEGVVSNVFWGFLPRVDLKTTDGFPISTTEISKITTLWANTTFGLLLFLAIADETDENLFHWKKQTLAHALLPDLECLSRLQITLLCGLFDRCATEDFQDTILERICVQKDLSLDSEFFKICLDSADWERFRSEIITNIKDLYQSGKNLFYFTQ